MLGFLLSIPLFFATVSTPPLEITLEHACTPEARAWGLMGRTTLPPNHGMLFHWDDNRSRMMWMFNTYLDLDAAAITADGIILEICYLQAHPEWMDPDRPVYSLRDIYPSSDPISQRYAHTAVRFRHPARYILEMPAGWFAAHGVRPGARLHFNGIYGRIAIEAAPTTPASLPYCAGSISSVWVAALSA